MNKIYDYIIVGAGISGLYFSYKLKNNNNNNFIILEKKPRLGGRIKTINMGCFSYDAGAVRISKSHKKTISLIKELKLTNQLIELSNRKTYFINNKFIKSNNKELNDIIKKGKKLNKNLRISNTFQGIGELISTSEKTNLAIIKTGYNSESVKLNFNDFLKETKTYNNKYYKFKDGLYEIINSLACKIGKDKILTSSFVENIEYKNNIFKIKSNNKIYKSKKIILAIPKNDLLNLKILSNYSNLLESVSSNNYIRVYAKYPKIKNKYWFEDLDTIITDKPLRKIIPVDKENGLIQISYCDHNFADILNNYNISGKLYIFIEKNLKKSFLN